MRLGERALTYAELDRAARGVATSLHARGIGPGKAVAIMIPNVPEFTMAYFGILYAGCTVVPLNVLLSAPEVAYHLQDSRAQSCYRAPALRGARREGRGRGGRAGRLEPTATRADDLPRARGRGAARARSIRPRPTTPR